MTFNQSAQHLQTLLAKLPQPQNTYNDAIVPPDVINWIYDRAIAHKQPWKVIDCQSCRVPFELDNINGIVDFRQLSIKCLLDGLRWPTEEGVAFLYSVCPACGHREEDVQSHERADRAGKATQ